MALSVEQIKGRLRNVAKQHNADARILMRIYMMERFLDRVAASKYKDNFIIKGGMLITALVGVGMRSTMDMTPPLRMRIFKRNLTALYPWEQISFRDIILADQYSKQINKLCVKEVDIALPLFNIRISQYLADKGRRKWQKKIYHL